MEVGASLVAFIGFGLTSIKTFHKFVTSIKDGPQRLQDLARALDSLRAAYERTQALQELPGILESSPSLLEQLRRCNDDVDRFSKTLVKMQIQPGERLYSTLRKKFKLPLCEDEIRDMLSIFSGHVSSFTLEISVLDIRIAHSNSSGISQVITGTEHQSNMMKQQHTSLKEIKEDVFRSSSQIEHVQTVVNALALKVENLPAVSTQHSTSILDMLVNLEGKVNELSLREQQMFDDTLRSVSAFDIAPCSGRNMESSNARVVGSIHRLSALLDKKNRDAKSDETQDIIDDLETLLQQMDMVFQHVEPGELMSHRKGFRGVEKDHCMDMKQAIKVLKGSLKLKLNPQTWSQRGPLSGKITKRKDNIALYQSQLGDWLVSTRRQWRSCGTQAEDKEHQKYSATISFKPTAQGGSHHIKVSIQQLQQANGFYAFTPVVSIGRIRPSNSRVFQCIKLGLFDEFFRLIATGEASLQDRDEKGAPLLHNTFNCLLAAGADPTLRCNGNPNQGELHFSLASYGDEPVFESLLSLDGIFFNVNDRDTDGQTLLHHSLLYARTAHISALIKLGADVNAKSFSGQSCLHYFMQTLRMIDFGFGSDVAALAILIEAGADIFSRDNEGRSIWETATENQEEGSYARDALDSVLVSYGYHAEVSRFAEEVPRHAIYVRDWYSRDDFEKLWAGNEHLCPYYDDEAFGLGRASFRHHGRHDESSDSSYDVEELKEKEYGNTGSEENEYSDSGEDEVLESEEGEKPASQQTEPDEATSPLEGSLTGIAKQMDSEPESPTGSGSQDSPSRYLHEVPRDNGQQVPLSASVASWLSTSRSPGETVLSNASPRGHGAVSHGVVSHVFDAEHADEIFHNPWTEG
ncbi:Putative fungal domain of STAND protein [Colletotrichum destructivum]|uniref:Fungal domain of STAND protein n=1 Tax=Colletotrichum destructivum TaxID=34406 RepID=A0AAX4I5W0_9PEZI|nr:Putative fungal domain of STAND protein [Colletotrichum destructivum]